MPFRFQILLLLFMLVSGLESHAQEKSLDSRPFFGRETIFTFPDDFQKFTGPVSKNIHSARLTNPSLSAQDFKFAQNTNFSVPNSVQPGSANYLPPSYYPLSVRDASRLTVRRFGSRVFEDFKNFHTKDTLMNCGVVLAGCGILANTKMDLRFQNWYRDDVKCRFTDEVSEFSKVFGEGAVFVPVTVISAFAYRFWQERGGHLDDRHPVGEFCDRTVRAYAVGAPSLLLLQVALGGNRPDTGSSYWKPFKESHAISGHAYIGAIPFLTAAEMSDRPLVKGLFYSLSILPGWGRVNDDTHYLSQAVLGWYFAYLSVRAVSMTENRKPLNKGLTIFPVVNGDAVGIGILLRR